MLVAANGLASPDAVLPIGRTLALPSPTVPPKPPANASGAPPGLPVRGQHTVVKGDTLYSIARRNATTVDALVAANGLASPDAILPIGRTLLIP